MLTLSRKNLFQVSKVNLGMGRIRGLRDKEMTIYGLVMHFVKIWVKDPVLDNCILTHFLYKIYIFVSMDVWANVVILLMYGSHDMRHRYSVG